MMVSSLKRIFQPLPPDVRCRTDDRHAGHADFTAGRFNRAGDVWMIGSNDNAIGTGFASALQNMDNHRLAVDILQRFPGRRVEANAQE
jgi:hypothetical protein